MLSTKFSYWHPKRKKGEGEGGCKNSCLILWGCCPLCSLLRVRVFCAFPLRFCPTWSVKAGPKSCAFVWLLFLLMTLFQFQRHFSIVLGQNDLQNSLSFWLGSRQNFARAHALKNCCSTVQWGSETSARERFAQLTAFPNAQLMFRSRTLWCRAGIWKTLFSKTSF